MGRAVHVAHKSLLSFWKYFFYPKASGRNFGFADLLNFECKVPTASVLNTVLSRVEIIMLKMSFGSHSASCASYEDDCITKCLSVVRVRNWLKISGVRTLIPAWYFNHWLVKIAFFLERETHVSPEGLDGPRAPSLNDSHLSSVALKREIPVPDSAKRQRAWCVNLVPGVLGIVTRPFMLLVYLELLDKLFPVVHCNLWSRFVRGTSSMLGRMLRFHIWPKNLVALPTGLC